MEHINNHDIKTGHPLFTIFLMPHKIKWSLSIALASIFFISGCEQHTSGNSPASKTDMGESTNDGCWRYYDVADAKKVIPAQWVRTSKDNMNDFKPGQKIISFCHMSLGAVALSGPDSADSLSIAVYQLNTPAEATKSVENHTKYTTHVPLTNTIGDFALWSYDNNDAQKQKGSLYFRKASYYVIVSHYLVGTPATKQDKYDFKALVESAAQTIESRL